MTEYTTSSEAIREYLTARERTAFWVHSHSQNSATGAFLSPSVPPSELDDSDAPSYGPSDSDEESNHSLPPRMVLRWNDGRPDVPIAPDTTKYLLPHPRSTTRSRRGDSRESSLSPIPRPSTVHPQPHPGYDVRPRAVTLMPSSRSRHAQTLSYASGPVLQGPPEAFDNPPPGSPEHIVILPSPQEEAAPNQVGAVPSQRSRVTLDIPTQSRSPTVLGAHPAHPTAPLDPALAILPEHQGIVAPKPRHAVAPSQASRHTTHTPSLVHGQPGENGVTRFHEPRARVASQLPYAYSPPAIVYAPSHKHSDSRYAPPAIVYSPPSNSHHYNPRPPAPGITYSHSAPLPHPHNTPGYPHGGPYPDARRFPLVEDEPGRSRSRGHVRSQSAVPSRSHSKHRRDESRGRSAAHPLIRGDRSQSRSRTPSSEEGHSGTSGSTYYVLPMPGQKVQIIQPNNAPSLYTATSATKTNQSPYSPASSQKKPFFQRIFSIPKFASSVDSRGSSGSTTRKLQRRHTLTAHQRRPSEV